MNNGRVNPTSKGMEEGTSERAGRAEKWWGVKPTVTFKGQREW